MKRILLFLLLFPGFAFAQTPAAQRTFSTSTQAADSIILTENGMFPYHRLMWSSSGTVTTCQVKLQQSTTGLFAGEETDLIAAQTCTSAGRSVLTIGNANFVRVNPTTLTGGGTLNVTYYGYQTYPLMEAGATGAGPSAFAVQGTTPTSSTIVGNPVVMGAVQGAGGNVQALVCANSGGTQCGLWQSTTQADGISAASSGIPYNPGNGSGLLSGLRVNVVRFNGATYDTELYCPNTDKINALGAATVALVAPVAGKKVRICSFQVSNNNATATTLKVVEGTGATCGTGTADLTSLMNIGASSTIPFSANVTPNSPWTTKTTGDGACLTGSAASSVEVTYTWEQH